MRGPNRRKVWVQVDPDTWQAYRVKCFAAGVQVQDSLGSFAAAVAQGQTQPRAAQLALDTATSSRPARKAPAKKAPAKKAPAKASPAKAPARKPSQKRRPTKWS